MKQKLISFLLAISALSLAGCGELAGNILEDGTAGSLLLTDSGSQTEDAAISDSLDADLPDSAGTAGSSEDVQWEEDLQELDENGTYNSMEDVSLYLHLYSHLPDNYITKSEAGELGWTGGSVERYAEGCAIGGDRFGNREGLLPSASGRTYYECDIDTIGQSSRGAKRIIFSNDGLIYYTEDHYESFTLLYGEE